MPMTGSMNSYKMAYMPLNFVHYGYDYFPHSLPENYYKKTDLTRCMRNMTTSIDKNLMLM